MKLINLVVFLFVFSTISGQYNLSATIGNELGFLQINRSEPDRWSDRNKYSISNSPTILLQLKFPKSNLGLDAKIQYTISNLPFFIESVLFRNGVGFPIIRINNNHVNLGLATSYTAINKDKFKLGGFCGVNVGIPTPTTKNITAYQGVLQHEEPGYLYTLHYIIFRSNYKTSLGIDSGIFMDFLLNKNIALSLRAYTRLGFNQTMIYDYFGELSISSQSNPLYDNFSSSFSNNGFMMLLGLKWYLW